MIAGLPMYDWPENRAATDARWSVLRQALRDAGFVAPQELTRDRDEQALWLVDDLLLAETCAHPLATSLRGKVRYVATPVHNAPGCGAGTYRSVLIMRGAGDNCPVPKTPAVHLPPLGAVLAANMAQSLSGYVGLQRDLASLGKPPFAPDHVQWTGSHRASIRAVASGDADCAAIDCVTWQLACIHEPAARHVYVAGWTAERPGLPLITSMGMSDVDLARMRRAIGAAIDCVVHAKPVDQPEPWEN